MELRPMTAADPTPTPERPEQDEAVKLLERWLSRPSTKSSRIVLESDTRWFLKNLATPPPVPAAPDEDDPMHTDEEYIEYGAMQYRRGKAQAQYEASIGAVPAAPPLDGPEIATIRKALGIGFTSWDGDGWYASKDHLGPDGTDYEDAESIFKEAFAILARLSPVQEAR